MRLAAILWALVAIPAGAQTFTLGTASDTCTQTPGTPGGPLTIFQSASTVRWGDFTCTFPVSVEGLYTVGLQFLEPCAQAGACAAGQITQAGQRLEHVFINSQPVLWNYDPYADIYLSAPVVPPTTTGQRIVLAYSHFGLISVHVQTVVRSGVLAGVTIAPFPVPQTIARSVCIGSGPGTATSLPWNCTGIELYAFAGWKTFTAVPATAQVLALPQCPTATGACWQPTPVGQ